MPPEERIDIIVAYKELGKEVIKETKKGLEDLEKTIIKTGRSFGYNLTFIAWHFRYLGNIFSRVGQQWQRMARNWIETAADLETAHFGVRAAAALYGLEEEKLTKISMNLFETGLIPLTEAFEVTRNILMTGLGAPQAEKMLKGMLDVSSLLATNQKELASSMMTLSESILRGTTLLIKDVAVRVLWAMATKRVAEETGKSMKEVSAATRAMAVYKVITEDLTFLQGLHEMRMLLLSGLLGRLKVSFDLLTRTLGLAFRPVLEAITPFLLSLTRALKDLIERTGNLIPIIFGVSTAFLLLAGNFAFLVGIALSFIKIIRGLAVELNTTTAAVIRMVTPFAMLPIILTGLAYAYLKYSGRLNEARQSQEKFNRIMGELRQRAKGLKQAFLDVTEVSKKDIERQEERRIAHQRTVEDITEQIEEEVSKGLWADQTRIRELRKRLKRENEDYQRYLASRKEGTEEESGLFGEISKDIENLEDKWNEANTTIQNNVLGLRETFSRMLQELPKDAAKFISAMIQEFENLPSVIQGLFAAILTYITLTWLPGMLSAFKRLVASAFASFASIRGGWAVLSATLSTPIAISILIGAAVTAIQEVRRQFRELKAELRGVQDSVSRASELEGQWLLRLREKYRAGAISQEEYLRRLQESLDFWRRFGKEVYPLFPSLPEELRLIRRSILGFQFGGFVPGPVGQPRLAVVHGGERIIPAREASAITININHPIVREEGDIRRLAETIKDVLSQRQRWAKLGAY